MSGSNRPSLLEWTQAALLAVNLAWTTLTLGGVRPGPMVVTCLLTAALLIVHSLSVVRARPGVSPPNESVTSSNEAAAGANRVICTPAVHPLGWLFVPFLVYAAINVAWVTPVGWLGWLDWFGWAQAIAVFWVALNGLRSVASRYLVWVALYSVATTNVLLACFQKFVDPHWLMLGRVQAEQYLSRASGSFGIPNSMAALMLLLLPVAGALVVRRRGGAVTRVFFGWLATVLLLGLGLTISRGAWLGLAIALTAWPVLFGRVRWQRRVLYATAVLAAVLGLGAITFVASAKVRERLTQLVHDSGERSRPILWRAAWQMIRSRPVVGTGGGSFNVEFEQYRPEGFLNDPLWAHNDYLNTLSDYGMIGAVLLFGAVAASIAKLMRVRRRLSRRRRTGEEVGRCGAPVLSASVERGQIAAAGTVRALSQDAFEDPIVRQAQAIGLLAFALQLFVDFHFKIPALAMACALVAAFVVRSYWNGHAHERQTDVPSSVSAASYKAVVPRVLAAAACLLVAGATLGVVVPLYRAESLRERARERIDDLANTPVTSAEYRSAIVAARAELARAVALAPNNAQAWADSAYGAAELSRAEPWAIRPLGRESDFDANRALALTSIVAEYWVRRGVARDMQGMWDAAGDDFTKALTLAPNTPMVWFHFAYHLSLRPTGLDEAAAMLATCLRLDPLNAEALRLRQQLATGRPRP